MRNHICGAASASAYRFRSRLEETAAFIVLGGHVEVSQMKRVEDGVVFPPGRMIGGITMTSTPGGIQTINLEHCVFKEWLDVCQEINARKLPIT